MVLSSSEVFSTLTSQLEIEKVLMKVLKIISPLKTSYHLLISLNWSLRRKTITWSNRHEQPSLATLDGFLISSEWDEIFLASFQKAPINSILDHIPILQDLHIGKLVNKGE